MVEDLKGKTMSESSNDHYDAQWKDFRKRLMLMLCLFLGALPGTYLIAHALGWVLKVKWDNLFPGVFVAWGIVYLGSIIHWVAFRCPRFHKRFGQKGLFANPFAYQCLHCGLPKGPSAR